MSPEKTDALSMWTVYDHPRDYPNDFVARLWMVDGFGVHVTDTLIVGPLAIIREELMGRGLICMPRMADDEPQIVEVWL